MITILVILFPLALCAGVWLGIRIEREQTLMWQEFWDGSILDHGYKHKAGVHK